MHHTTITQIDGKKDWFFIDPYDTFLGYPMCILGRAAGILMCLWPDDFNREAFPLFDYCPIYHTTLDAGELRVCVCVLNVFAFVRVYGDFVIHYLCAKCVHNCFPSLCALMFYLPSTFIPHTTVLQVTCCSTLPGGGTRSRT